MIFNYDSYEVEYTAVVSQVTLFSIAHDVVGVRGISWVKNPDPGDVELAGVFDMADSAFVLFAFTGAKVYIGQIENNKYLQGCSFRGEHMLYFRQGTSHMMQIMY